MIRRPEGMQPTGVERGDHRLTLNTERTQGVPKRTHGAVGPNPLQLQLEVHRRIGGVQPLHHRVNRDDSQLAIIHPNALQLGVRHVADVAATSRGPVDSEIVHEHENTVTCPHDIAFDDLSASVGGPFPGLQSVLCRRGALVEATVTRDLHFRALTQTVRLRR